MKTNIKINRLIGLTFALAITLAAFEWKTSFNMNTTLPGTKIEEMLIAEEPPVCIVKKIKEKTEIVKTERLKKSEVVAAVPEKIEIVKTDENQVFNLDEIKPIETEETFVDERENIFIPVEQMPQFPGGEMELLKFLKNNVQYPKMSKELGITGTVYVEFIVDVDGALTSIKIAKGVSSDIDKEALRIVSMMPKWSPGSQRNMPVQVGMRLPIRFTLM